MPLNITDNIKLAKSTVFREVYIKRRLQGSGLFEDEWYEITEDVKKWGSISISITPERPDDIKFSNLKITVANDQGRYNPNTDVNSLWYGYLDSQRTLIKIEFGFLNQEKTNGIWANYKSPGEAAGSWDVALFDLDLWDYRDETIAYHGIIYGDIDLSDKNEVSLNIAPLTQLFRDYPARRLAGYTTTGLTASKFFENVRDHQDGGGNYIFRPFFEDTTTNWNIETTTSNYLNLNTTTAKEIVDQSVWDVMKSLAIAENFIPYTDFNGVFRFKNRVISGSSTYDFYGRGFFNESSGHTIKSIDRFGPKISSLFTRIQIQYSEDNTTSSYVFAEADLSISSANLPWTFGYRTFEISNYYIPTSTVAQTLADSLLNELSNLKNEIEFSTSFIPHLRILDPVTISYSTQERNPLSIWDENNWDTTLIWDDNSGDAINLNREEYFLTKIVLNLERFESQFTAREQ